MSAGTLFRIDPATGTQLDLYSFTANPDGKYPCSDLVQQNGTLYGTTIFGGTDGIGSVFSYSLATGEEAVLHSFTGPDGGNPLADLLPDRRFLYGLTVNGGVGNNGLLFRMSVPTPERVGVARFHQRPRDGTSPAGGVTAYNGKIYGVTYSGGSAGAGTVFALNPGGGRLRTLHAFSGGC